MRLSVRTPARGLVLVLTMSLVLGGCQTTRGADRAELTPEQLALREQADEFNSTVGTGAVAGAVIGGLLGALLDSNNRGRGAALGAAAGAALGGGAGYYIASQNERYASSEQALYAKIQAADREVVRFRGMVANTQTVVAQQRQRLQMLQQQYRAGRVSEAEYRNRLAVAREDAEAIQTMIGGNQEIVQAMQGDIHALRRRGEDTRALEQRLAELQRSQRELRNQYDRMSDAMNLVS